MRIEALVLDRDDRIDEVGRKVVEVNQLALRTVGSVVGTKWFGFEKNRTYRTPAG